MDNLVLSCCYCCSDEMVIEQSKYDGGQISLIVEDGGNKATFGLNRDNWAKLKKHIDAIFKNEC